MATYTLTGSFSVTMGGRDITTGGPLTFGYLGNVIQDGYSPITTRVGYAQPPSVAMYDFSEPPDQSPATDPWTTNTTPQSTVNLADTSGADNNRGFKAFVFAGGVPASTSFAQLCGVQALRQFRWAVYYYPGQDLLPTWGSTWSGIYILQGSNIYQDPIFAASTTDIGDITNPFTQPPWGTFPFVPPNNLVLLTGQSISNQNGIWYVTVHSGNQYTWVRPSAWSSWLAAWDNTNGPNSIAENYVYYGGSAEPYQVNGLTLYLLQSADGLTWSTMTSAKLAYSTGDKVIGNDGQCYTTNGAIDPTFAENHIDPTFAGKVVRPDNVFPWTTSTYQTTANRAVDVGNLPLTITPQLACTVFSDTYSPSGGPLGQGGYVISALTTGYSVDIYSVHGEDTTGTYIGNFASQAPNNSHGTQNPYPPSSGYQTIDWLLGGDGKQSYYDGNPVVCALSAGQSYAIGTISVSGGTAIANPLVSLGRFTAGTSASAVQSSINAAINTTGAVAIFGGGSCIVTGGGPWNVYFFGPIGINLAAIGCQNLYLIVNGSSSTSNPLVGTSVAWYGNIYQFDPTYGNTLKLTGWNGRSYATYTTATLPAAATAAQVRSALDGAVSAGVISGYGVRQSGVLLTITIRSSSDPNPKMSSLTNSGLILRSPWRAVVNYPSGAKLDSYAPVGAARVMGITPFSQVTAVNTVRGGSLTSRPGTTASVQWWIEVMINNGNPSPSNPSVAASATSVAPDYLARPVIAIDTGSGTEIAITADAGETWTTNAGPSGTLPSLVIDRKSNAYILATNSGGGTVTIRRNPNADWSSTVGMTTLTTISNAYAAGIYGEPNNERHLAMTFVDGSGNLKVQQSFDGGVNWQTAVTVVTGGMATNRGFAAYVRWIGGSMFAVYSKGTAMYIQRSIDGGATWQAAVTVASGHTYTGGACVEQFGVLVVFAQDDTGSSTPWHTWQSGDLGATWTETTNSTTPQPAAGSFPAFGVWPLSGKLLISASNVGA